MSDRIPKKIYYCWFGEEKPQNVLDCINNWKEKLPDYEIIEINENNNNLFDIAKECQNNLWLKTCYEQKMWAYVADYARLKVLYEYGGIYFDTDITVEKDITDLVNRNKLILGWESKCDISNGVIIVPKNNNNIFEILSFYNEEIWKSKIYTIPQITTYVINKNYKLCPSNEITENDEILILPPDYFYPLPSCVRENVEKYITDNTYTVHWWNASWLKSNINYFLRHKHKIPLQHLLSKCFNKNVVYKNSFISIEMLCTEIFIHIDFSYMFKFRYKYFNGDRFLTIFIFGFQIKLWKM